MQQISEETKKQVIDLHFNEHKPYVEIAEIERISPCDIYAIIKKKPGDKKNKHEKQQA